MGDIKFRIAHISDTHISDFGQFVNSSFEDGVELLNSLDPKPNIIVHSGDLTDNGVLSEYKLALEKLSEFDQRVVITAGNHDQRNFGNSLFDEFIGRLDYEIKIDDFQFLIINSAEPDRDEGRIGRRRMEWISNTLAKDKIKILVFHHHLIPVPYSGREVNVLEDAGDILDMAIRNKVHLVLMGHRHVRHATRVED
ncbi:MAG TPA: metallophosphoesterase, partial [Geobacterales bacterium]|nr:metallophosphoesterase [Geobacterales bacterium]